VWSAALRRFNELTRPDLDIEFHAHTTYTDGRMSVAEAVRTAAEQQLRLFVLTDHVRRETDWFPAFAAEILAQPYTAGLDVGIGCEAKILDRTGALDVTDAIRAACDLVLASVHGIPVAGRFVKPRDLPPAELEKAERELALSVLSNGTADVLAHPMGMFQSTTRTFPHASMAALVEAAAASDVAIEISSSYLVDVPAFLELCERHNPVVSIGSDAHGVEDVGRCRAGLLEQCAWNR
jgi:putative hydrolase